MDKVFGDPKSLVDIKGDSFLHKYEKIVVRKSLGVSFCSGGRTILSLEPGLPKRNLVRATAHLE